MNKRYQTSSQVRFRFCYAKEWGRGAECESTLVVVVFCNLDLDRRTLAMGF